jgi:mono/diheme cytochrome c family protein
MMSSLRHLAALIVLALATGCDMQDMWRQPKKEPLTPSTMFDNDMASRPVVPDTVARGQLRTNDVFYTGKIDGKDVETIPMPVTKEVLLHGQERFNIYCAPCHDRTGGGNGIVVQRGLRQPPSYHTEKLRTMAIGHFYDVMSNGFGTMRSYASQITPEDRWAIAAYVRALQFSEYAPAADVPAAELPKLKEAGK